MGRIGFLLVLLASFFPPLVFGAAKGPIVAVFEIQPRGIELDKETIANLTEYLSTALAEDGNYRVVPPGDIRSALTNKAKESHKRCYDKECQIELGRELAANKIASSSILKIGQTCIVTCNLYDLKSKTAELSAKAEGGCDIGALLSLLRTASQKVCSKLSSRPHESDLDKILEQTKRSSEKQNRASKAWVMITKIASDESLPVKKRAAALRAYMQEFGKDNLNYKRAKKMLAGIPASINLKGAPAGAAIWIDGKKTGEIPAELLLPAGKHEIVASHSGYESEEKTIALEPAEQIEVSFSLIKAAPARLFVRTKPTGAQVSLDGKKQGRSPLELKIAPGKHRIAAERKNYSPRIKEVDLISGRITEIDLRLEKPPPYTTWGHITFWSGLGLAALGSISAYMAYTTGQEANDKTSNSLRDESIAWEGAMWAFLPAGGALLISGIVLWTIAPTESPDSVPGFTVAPGLDGGCTISLRGSF